MWVGSARPESSARVLDYWLLSRYGPHLLASSEKRPLPKIGTGCCPGNLGPSTLPGKTLLQPCSVTQQRLHPPCTGPSRSLVGFPSKKQVETCGRNPELPGRAQQALPHLYSPNSTELQLVRNSGR